MARRRRRPTQLALLDATGTRVAKAAAKKVRKGKRGTGVRLGRPPRVDRAGFVPHGVRDEHDRRHPVHVSMRRVKLAPSLRSQRIYAAIVAQLARAARDAKTPVRVVHYSVQGDHLHLIVEAKDRHDLSNQMRKLFSRIALAVNIAAGRRGKLFRDRHHREELASPTRVRNALVYVLFNARKHHAQNGGAITEAFLNEVDPCSSMAWLEGWAEHARPPPEELERIRRWHVDEAGGRPIAAPDTWLARVGWQRGGGRLSIHELPRFL